MFWQRTFAICLYLFVFHSVCFSQTIRILGQINDEENHITLASVNLFNKRTNVAIVSSEDGRFSINASKGDLIILSKTGYYTDTVLISDEQFMNLNMVRKPIALEEVTVTGKRNSPLEQYEANKEAYKSIYLKGNKKDMVNGLAINLNKVFSALSKEGKDARRLQRILENEYQMGEIDVKFNKTLIQDLTNLEGKDLDDFIFEYRPDYEWIKSATDYDIILYIKEKMKDFSKSKKEINIDFLDFSD